VRDLDSADAAGTLAAAIRAVARSASLDEALDAVLRGVASDLGADRGLVVATNEDPSRRRVLRSLGFAEGQLTLIDCGATEADDLLAVAAAEQRSVEVAAGGARDEGGSPREALVDRLGLALLRARPLVVARGGIEQVVGVIGIGWTAQAQATPGTPGLVEALADLAALALDRAHLASGMAERGEWLERLAHIDPLTGLANRRTFDRVLELEVARAIRQQSEVAVAVFDVDSFREVNEAAGRAAGDDILRAVAAVLAEQVRLVDTVARIGGDEFIVVAPGTGGLAVADRVIRAIQALPAVGGRAISVSAGVARFPVDAGSADELLVGALDALERARAGGRGAVASALAAASAPAAS
jgi:diguanylate cyclase (GGDEF)-like protein